ncbi:hypothetical protein SAMD00019534_094190 [Acytostelium subglobosum LB1]|uniref:hypothetical protein n=1 Tax=Acytostelium subglobosum LB1 TaxID=1410327 RepID=UPI000644C48D|nr:hypothetical protein SAMD00019534_094190 [Acytostelium subglobosum LB1]GAM26244.1 hypothetical protein SAMD00019534_094190 [Acytostelium subglobosum LB1]|eukprot:XP_012750798.1 hypothetical protein SAMD00019534_094190 [Acytostelium subglobosum LB1]
MRFFSTVLIALAIIAAVSAYDFNAKILNDRFIQSHNAKGASWVAGRNARFESATIGDVVSLLGTKKPRNTPEGPAVVADIPAAFDARTNWPGCIHAVLNQGQCGSCWAFGASESLSDRFCIASKGAINVTLSPQALVSCDTVLNQGCNGGIPQAAWEYMEAKGLPTYDCFPYTSGANGTEPPCQKTCSDGSTYTLYKAKTLTLQTMNSVSAIQANLVAYGSIEGSMDVYDDFMTYTSGVYVQSPTAKYLGGHAIKIIGWGHDDASNLDYWIVQNSWGTDWGMDGFFWIERGVNMCGIDRDSSAAQANV